MSEIAIGRMIGLGPRMRLAALAALGAAAGLGQAPVSFPWITLAALWAIFLIFEDSGSLRRAVLTGWVAGAGYFALSLSWIVEPFLVDIVRQGWMAPFALFFSAFGFGMFWALGFGVAHWVARPGWPRAVAWALALSGAEMLRSYVMTGFPWALIGHIWIGWAPMQLAAWIGAQGLTLLTLLVVVGISGAWSLRVGALAAGAVLYGIGAWQAALPIPGTDDVRPVVRLVQPNAAQRLKWDPVMAPQFFARQLDYTAAPADRRPDLVIWPETAIPYLLNGAEDVLDQITEAAAGVPVALGIQRLDGNRAYNSMIVLDSAGQISELYDKYHLVPFGEYVPAEWLLGPLGLSSLTAKEGYGFSAGPGARVLDLGPLGQVLPLICYEAIFPQDVRAAPTRPDWLMQITNDAWFGKISGPYQHLAQARLRAVEAGLPMLRAANTGVSAVIDARGQVTDFLPLGQAGYLDAALPPSLPVTLYSRTGDLPLGLILLLALGALYATTRPKFD